MNLQFMFCILIFFFKMFTILTETSNIHKTETSNITKQNKSENN